MAKDKKQKDEFSNEALNLPEENNTDVTANESFGNEYNPDDIANQNEEVGDTITVSQTEVPELQDVNIGDDVDLSIKAKVKNIDDTTGDVTLDIVSYNSGQNNENIMPQEIPQAPQETGANELASILGGK